MADVCRPPVGQVGESRRFESLSHLLSDGVLTTRPEAPAPPDARAHRQGHVLGDGELAEQGRALEGAPEPEARPLPGGKRGRVACAESNRTLRRTELARNHIEESCLPAPLGPISARRSPDAISRLTSSSTA